jgi:hypothetical protein
MNDIKFWTKAFLFYFEEFLFVAKVEIVGDHP